jgi:hypothetical protein
MVHRVDEPQTLRLGKESPAPANSRVTRGMVGRIGAVLARLLRRLWTTRARQVTITSQGHFFYMRRQPWSNRRGCFV